MRRCPWIEAALLGAALLCVQSSATAGETRWATMPELVRLAKVDETAHEYLFRYLLGNDLIFAVEASAYDNTPETDADREKIRMFEAAKGKEAAMIFTSERALFVAGEKLRWPRNAEGSYDFVRLPGREAFAVLATNGIGIAVLNWGDDGSMYLGPSEIDGLADGIIPPFDAARLAEED